MENIVFISVFNKGCIEIAENHLVSLVKSGIKNYMAYVTDGESFEILKTKGYQVKYDMDFATKDKMDFGTEKFNAISYMRYAIINKLLKEGKTVWYLDVDTVVLANLNQIVPELLSNFELVMQHDINMPCSGCMLFPPSQKMIDLTEWMYNNRTTDENDQIRLVKLLQETNTGINLYLLDHHHFPNGLLYFNELHTDPKFAELHADFKNSQKQVYFVHANWMVGIDKKIQALKSKNLWFL
jgi:lipopolysaccharide biosynthesis glycosyltransferase